MTGLPVTDREIRDLLVVVDPEGQARALVAARARLDAEMAGVREAPGASSWGGRKRPPRRVHVRVARIALAGAVAALIAVGVSVAPVGRDGSPAGVPQLAATATASEALDWASRAVAVDAGAVAGSGDVYHGVSVTREDGELLEVDEQWYDATGTAYRTLQVETHPLLLLRVHDFDGTVERLRAYQRIDGAWQLPRLMPQLDVPGGRGAQADLFGGPPRRGMDPGPLDRSPGVYDGAPYRISATATIERATGGWVRTMTEAETGADLTRAVAAFVKATRGYFAGPARDRSEEDRRATTVRQLLHLLEVTPSGDAASAIYRELAQVEGLVRLEDQVVDGERLVRVQLTDLSSITADADGVREHFLRLGGLVLLIDEDGLPRGLVSLDGSIVTTTSPPERVDAIGADPFTCSAAATVIPCDLVAGEGALAAAADAAAREPAARLHGASMAGSVRPVEVDAQGRAFHDDGTPARTYQLDARGRVIPILPPEDPN